MLKQIQARLAKPVVAAATAKVYMAIMPEPNGKALTIGKDCRRLTDAYGSASGASCHVLPNMEDPEGKPLFAVIGASKNAVVNSLKLYFENRKSAAEVAKYVREVPTVF